MKKVQNPISMLNTDEIAAHAEHLQEAAQALAMEMRSQTGQAVHRTTEQAKASASKLAEEARHKVESKVDEQKAVAATRLENVASVLRKTSKELHGAHEDALANYTGSAAEQFERLASALRPPQSNSLFARIGRFAKRRPIMFVLTVLATIFGLRMAIKNFDLWGPMFTSAVGSNQSWNGSHSSAHSGSTTGTSTGSSSE
jgi:hypothetical protein